MRMRIVPLLVATAATMAVASGCQDPPEMVQSAPPGYEKNDPPPIPPGGGAQAIGEQVLPSTKQNKVASTIAEAPPTPIGKPTTLPSGLTYETVKEGTGAVAKVGQTITIHYNGTLADGTKFDSSRDSGHPFTTPIGTKNVIDGWDQGVPGMKVGEVRKLTIPPTLGYGDKGFPPKIPAGATLVFEVELLDVK